MGDRAQWTGRDGAQITAGNAQDLGDEVARYSARKALEDACKAVCSQCKAGQRASVSDIHGYIHDYGSLSRLCEANKIHRFMERDDGQ